MTDTLKTTEGADLSAQHDIEHHRADDDGMTQRASTAMGDMAQRISGITGGQGHTWVGDEPNDGRGVGTEPLSTQALWNAATQDAYSKIALEAAAELRRGDAIHGRGITWPTNSVSHEAYGVLLEEVDELWDEVKKRVIDRKAMRKEAIQVAAMAIRFVMNVCDENPDPPGAHP